MGNPHKGEIAFTLDKTVYTLRYSINAMCELEDRMGTTVVEIGALMSDPTKLSIGMVRSIFWAGLRDHHEVVTEQDAGRLMDALGLVNAAQMIGKAFTAAFPEVQASGPLPAAPGASTGKAH
jgi:tail tube GTA-gp10-like protein